MDKEAIVIQRNETDLTFGQEKYRRGEKKKAGLTYIAPTGEVALETYIKFLGTEVAKEIVERQFKLWCQHWTREATDEKDGTTSAEEFEKFVKTLSARGETMKSLLGRRDEIFDLMAELDQDKPEDMVKMAKLMVEAKKIKEALVEKRTKDEDDDGNATTN